MFYQDNHTRVLVRIQTDAETMEDAVDFIDEFVEDGRITPEQEDRIYQWATHWFNVLEAMRELNQPQQNLANMAPLQRLAHDNQNVHTAEVNAQTKRAIDILTSVPMPHLQSTLQEIKSKVNPNTYYDVTGWYAVQDNDRLYKRLLDGCVAYINASSHKTELWTRLCQEMDESVTKCWMGHITRLCNTFVGFDDRFAAPVPVGELLQQRMSAIAAKDIETEAKIDEAIAVLDELNVPDSERAAWLDAF